jgi:hypothetical protein
MDFYTSPQYIECKTTKLTESEAAIALREAWKIIYGSYPVSKQLALLWAQVILETGRFNSCRNYNFGNIKKTFAPDDGHSFTMFKCNEVIKGKLIWFEPPHIQTVFRAYKSAQDGAEDYIKFVSKKPRYKEAWKAVLIGDPVLYCKELKKSGYFTADLNLYTKGVVRLTNEFLSRASKLLMTGYVFETKDEILTEEETAKIKSMVSMGIDDSVYEYFSTARIDNADDNEYYQIKNEGIVSWIGKLFGKK